MKIMYVKKQMSITYFFILVGESNNWMRIVMGMQAEILWPNPNPRKQHRAIMTEDMSIMIEMQLFIHLGHIWPD